MKLVYGRFLQCIIIYLKETEIENLNQTSPNYLMFSGLRFCFGILRTWGIVVLIIHLRVQCNGVITICKYRSSLFFFLGHVICYSLLYYELMPGLSSNLRHQYSRVTDKKTDINNQVGWSWSVVKLRWFCTQTNIK